MVDLFFGRFVMLSHEFKNSQNIDLHSALSVFVVMMGLLFYIDAAPGMHSTVAILTVLCGLLWYAGHKAFFKAMQLQ